MPNWKKIIFPLNFLQKVEEKRRLKFTKKELASLIGHVPKNIDIFIECFTHPSFINNEQKNFERLEFLGDSVLSLIVSEFLFKKAPNQKEGYLTQIRSKIVSRKTLNKIGEELNLIYFLSKQKNMTLGDDIYGNLYESLVGAVFIDGGIQKCSNFIHKTLLNNQNLDLLERKISSYKSLLIEWGQKNKINIKFDTQKEQNNKEEKIIFDSYISLNDEIISKGRAISKKKAEEITAKRAYYKLYDKIKNERKAPDFKPR